MVVIRREKKIRSRSEHDPDGPDSVSAAGSGSEIQDDNGSVTGRNGIEICIEGGLKRVSLYYPDLTAIPKRRDAASIIYPAVLINVRLCAESYSMIE